ncbi:hypothetical protein HYH02_013381 [Chlamydomonas schloesseri]|uniref:Uncharacterized protein n=1 Tax=Chlamydomonas schloesseri TaxID=2026947 RepID=A0A835VVU4_9CHLO|nr:hypothetical protein HYH02_013381 [Chlamydomonas schloesseri]|eukprot:KAG2431247.1 hypothetical protein HYH02_013381 [Chlamydomonas schloesseri]
MAGVAAWSLARKDIKTLINSAQDFHDQTAVGWEDEEDIEELRTTTGKLASSSKAALDLSRRIEATYGDTIADLQAFKDTTIFSAKYRDHVSAFEDMVFVHMALPETMEPKVAAAVATKDSVLSSLSTFTRMAARRDDPAAAAFVRSFSCVSQAWDDAVKGAGLSLEDYAALRAFKDKSNASFHAADEPQQALLVLESNSPVPEDVQPYKEPLIALLRILSRP